MHQIRLDGKGGQILEQETHQDIDKKIIQNKPAKNRDAVLPGEKGLNKAVKIKSQTNCNRKQIQNQKLQ